MTRRFTRALRAAAGALLLNFTGIPAHAGVPDADALSRHARERLALSDLDQRRLGLGELEQAARLDPARADLWLELGRQHHLLGHPRESRTFFEKAGTLAPDDPGVQLELGEAWKWDWLAGLEPASFNRAVECLDRATRQSPGDAGGWLDATALALVRGDGQLCALAAMRAHDASPESGETVLALACAAFRLGRMHLADSLFAEARRRLPIEMGRRFDDLSLVTGPSASEAGSQEDAAARWWATHDPDITTPENEARLDFCSRVGQTLLLFRDGQSVRWDLRSELVVRYGLPSRIDYNRPTSALQSKGLTAVENMRADTIEFGYPFNEQVWSYPALGMKAVLWDRTLREQYSLSLAERSDPDPRPDPAVVAGRTDLIALGGGRGVYRALPPGIHPREARAHLIRFPGENGGRLVAHLMTPGAPDDTLWGTWVVRDDSGREVARAERALSVSACDPTGLRTADFAADLAAGHYQVGFAVADAHQGRGVTCIDAEITPRPPGISLSDVVLLCGDPTPAASAPGVRIEPSYDGRITRRRTLTVYFEIAGMALDTHGGSRFTYTYRVHREGARDEKGIAPTPEIEATREESNVGTLRRQFVTVPIDRLKDGRYTLEVEVRDAIAGAVATGSVDFARRTSAPGTVTP
jgi:tetratricopeptide (TPR) repeat protein